MTPPKKATGRALRALLLRAVGSPYFWGAIGWALLILRYTSEVIHPRYGG